MVRSFVATPLVADDIDPAFALVRAWYPGVSLEAWREYTQALAGEAASRQSGIVGIRNEAGYLCGLFVFRIEVDLGLGRVLVVDPVAALDFVDPKTVAQAMLDAGDATAHRLQCSATRFRVPDARAWFAKFLQTSGHRVEAQVLSAAAALPSRLV